MGVGFDQWFFRAEASKLIFVPEAITGPGDMIPFPWGLLAPTHRSDWFLASDKE